MAMESFLAEFHRSHGAVFFEREGALRPAHFGDAAIEYRAVRSSVGLIDLCHRALLQFTGPDRLSFLQGMLSNDLRSPGLLIGCSTHSREQAEQAVRDGADYIGVGPIFSTQTKEDVCAPVGLNYLDYVAKNVHIPYVAIGGTKRETLPQVLAHGAKTVCLVTEIIGAEDIGQRVREIQQIMAAAKL